MVKNSTVSVFLLTLLTLTACRRDARNENSNTPPPSLASATPAASAPSAAPSASSTSDHAEVFRRAFWRHPTAADRIVQAERRVDPADDSWSWFIQLHPSPELLAALRDPDTFGLLPPGMPGSSSAPPLESPPTWFPAIDQTGDFTILQAPATGLTVLYRASDDTLFATDTGVGFAPPAR